MLNESPNLPWGHKTAGLESSRFRQTLELYASNGPPTTVGLIGENPISNNFGKIGRIRLLFKFAPGTLVSFSGFYAQIDL